METRAVMAPPPPKRLDELSLPEVFMRDIALKTVFRKNANTVTHLSRAMCLPIGITQEIMTQALEQAKAGRAHILGKMTEALGSFTYKKRMMGSSSKKSSLWKLKL